MPYLSAVKINLYPRAVWRHAGRALPRGDVLHFQPYKPTGDFPICGPGSPNTEDHKPLVAS